MLSPNRNPNDHNDCDLLARFFLHSFKHFESQIYLIKTERKYHNIDTRQFFDCDRNLTVAFWSHTLKRRSSRIEVFYRIHICIFVLLDISKSYYYLSPNIGSTKIITFSMLIKQVEWPYLKQIYNPCISSLQLKLSL